MPFEITERKEIYKCGIFTVVEDETLLPDGKKAVYSKVLHNGAAVVVPVANDGGVYLVRQHRPAPGIETLELPAGKLEPGEPPQECAARELEEETGYRAGKISFLIKFYSAIGYSNEMLHVYVAEELEVGSQNLDEDEFVTVEKYSLSELRAMILNGEIVDSKTIAGVLAYGLSAG